MAEVTVVFADLTGSTAIFESLGNAKATQAITGLTHWVGKVCHAHKGRVVKYLGDGVLAVFPVNSQALDAVTEMQRRHLDRLRSWPDPLKMRLQIGMARGQIVEQDGDCFGDAVNVASRLSDLSGPDQILATDAVINQLAPNSPVRSRSLGPMTIRGRVEPCDVHRIEWQNEVLSDFLTVAASLAPSVFSPSTAPPERIELSWLDVNASFGVEQLPVFLGRDLDAQFVVQDPRVSRKHAKIEWRAGKFYLQDVSSYGTSVRFGGTGAVVTLRRQECVLLQDGEIAMGGPFEDFTVPTVSFRFSAARAGRPK